MNLKEKNKYKSDFKKELDMFADKLEKYVSTDNGDWTVKGFIDVYKNIYTISSDTKIVSKILEIHIFPQILQFADSIGYKIILAEKQNWYPDLTFVKKDNEEVKFALDIKTTFRRNDKTAGFTLGSHGGYFKERDKDKNIQFPYNQYTGHYCLGVIYTRTDVSDDLAETEIYQVQELQEEYETPKKKVGERSVTTVKNLKSITSVIKDFDFFAAEKWKIASDKQGSGNTANIGSIFDIDDLKNENGIFSKLGEEWFDEYWINHGSAIIVKDGKPTKITTLKDFLEFKNRKELLSKIVAKTKGNKTLSKKVAVKKSSKKTALKKFPKKKGGKK
ncbi:restriction endonuclease EcoRV [Lacibacter cauensis]|uniref:Restriction endonuclease EcoRV n=1 Tax=Lacibacter cauensis TaxID=510947 RepID=A0A562SSQ3_9BACT|nr:type II restriction endonuclease [Lacibacter cauensis]TWI83820.1 restriction endonuclease EcoRV [Lacibacter cauensis]